MADRNKSAKKRFNPLAQRPSVPTTNTRPGSRFSDKTKDTINPIADVGKKIVAEALGSTVGSVAQQVFAAQPQARASSSIAQRDQLYLGYKNYEKAYDKIDADIHAAATGKMFKPPLDVRALKKKQKQFIEEIISLRKEVTATYPELDQSKFNHEKTISQWEEWLQVLQ